MTKKPQYFPLTERKRAEDYFYKMVALEPRYIGWFRFGYLGYIVQFVPSVNKNVTVEKIHGSI